MADLSDRNWAAQQNLLFGEKWILYRIVYADVGIKVAQFSPKVAQKVATAVFIRWEIVSGMNRCQITQFTIGHIPMWTDGIKSSPIFTKSCPKSWLKIAQIFQMWVKSSQNSFYLKTRRFKIAQRHQNFGQLFQENLSPRTKKSPNLVTLTLPYKILWRYFATFGNILKSFGHFREFWPNF